MGVSNTRIYVLGILARYGEQHGYSIRQRLVEQVSDFASIELANIYYHLGKLEKDGLLVSSTDKEGRRPERTVYSITGAGRKFLSGSLLEAMEDPSAMHFSIDAVIFFLDMLPGGYETLMAGLGKRRNRLEGVLKELSLHRKRVLEEAPSELVFTVKALFSHHELHIRAEIEWLRGMQNGMA